MVHNHTEEPCKHDLKVCTLCGVVYCAKCNEEWHKGKNPSYPDEYEKIYVNPIATKIADSMFSSHTHVHD